MLKLVLALACLSLSGCGMVAKNELKAACEARARIIVHDPALWAERLAAKPFPDGARPQSPLLGYVEGFDFTTASYERSKAHRRKYGAPPQDDLPDFYTVEEDRWFYSKNAQPVAEVITFSVLVESFAAHTGYDCVRDFPYVYGLEDQS